MFIILYIHTHVGTCSSCNDTVAIMVIPDSVWHQVVGYKMYDDVDDSYNV